MEPGSFQRIIYIIYLSFQVQKVSHLRVQYLVHVKRKYGDGDKPTCTLTVIVSIHVSPHHNPFLSPNLDRISVAQYSVVRALYGFRTRTAVFEIRVLEYSSTPYSSTRTSYERTVGRNDNNKKFIFRTHTHFQILVLRTVPASIRILELKH